MGTAKIYLFHPDSGADALAMRSDRALARKAASGDRVAFHKIVETHKQRMLTVARSVVNDPAQAEDVVQESFLKAYRAMAEFRGDAQLSTWLFRITYLTAIDIKRQMNRQQRLTVDHDGDIEFEDEINARRGDGELETVQLRQRIDQALSNLSPFEKTVFTLRHMQNFKLREIAQVVDRSEGTVKSILFRAIRKMREQLAGEVFVVQEIEQC